MTEIKQHDRRGKVAYVLDTDARTMRKMPPTVDPDLHMLRKGGPSWSTELDFLKDAQEFGILTQEIETTKGEHWTATLEQFWIEGYDPELLDEPPQQALHQMHWRRRPAAQATLF